MPSSVYIKGLFDSIAEKYDLLNNLLSFGLHWKWKKKFSQIIKADGNKLVLDAATGTGDIAHLLKNQGIQVQGIDLSHEMIKVAKKRFPDITFSVEDSLNLSFEDKSFDASSMAFGIRNTESISKTLKELARVSKSHVYILEFGTPQNTFFKTIYFFIMKKFIPSLGKIFGMKKSYEYLIDSSIEFPSDKNFIKIADELNVFSKSSYKPVFGGICYIYTLKI